MIRDPSDGSVREPAICWPTPKDQKPVIDTSTSGLPITKAKDLERLEESRKWLKSYVQKTINV